MAAKPTKTRTKDVVERNVALTGELMHYLLERPQMFNALPENFELVILPDDDPDMRLYNLELLDNYGSGGKPIVFVRMKSRRGSLSSEANLRLYVPVAA